MRLSQLEPQFFRYDIRIEKYHVVDGEWVDEKKDYILNCGKWWKELTEAEHEANVGTKEVEGPREYLVYVETLSEAHGIQFLCPKCFVNNKRPSGTHSCLMPFANRGYTKPTMWECVRNWL